MLKLKDGDKVLYPHRDAVRELYIIAKNGGYGVWSVTFRDKLVIKVKVYRSKLLQEMYEA